MKIVHLSAYILASEITIIVLSTNEYRSMMKWLAKEIGIYSNNKLPYYNEPAMSTLWYRLKLKLIYNLSQHTQYDGQTKHNWGSSSFSILFMQCMNWIVPHVNQSCTDTVHHACFVLKLDSILKQCWHRSCTTLTYQLALLYVLSAAVTGYNLNSLTTRFVTQNWEYFHDLQVNLENIFLYS